MVTNAYIDNGFTITPNFVRNITVCKDCAYRLYAKSEQKIIIGDGNINSSAILVVRNPNDARVLNELYKKLVADDSELYDNFCIIYAIKCHTNREIGFNDRCIASCANILHDEFTIFSNIKDIIFVGPKLLEIYTRTEARIANTLLGKRNFDCIYPMTVLKHSRDAISNYFVDAFKKVLTKYNIPLREYQNNQIKDD